MLRFESDLEGKHVQLGFLRDKIEHYGFCLGGYWEYDQGYFDTILSKQNDETIYLRLPFIVIDGKHDSYQAFIQFQTPYVIKQNGNFGLNFDEHSLLDATGFNLYQTPIAKDTEIPNKEQWVHAGEQVVEKVLQFIH